MDPLAPKVYAEFFGLTDVGRKRRQNEDNLLIADLQNQRQGKPGLYYHWQVGGRGLLFAVCDGMGGAAAGEVASQMAVDVVYSELLDLDPGLEPQEFAQIIDRAIQTANYKIHEYSKKDRSKKGMGTTISAAAVYGNILFLAQVGDSRAYILRGGKLTQVTKDQSLLQRLIQEGAISPEHAQNFVGKNVILQALGPSPQVLVDLKFIELEEGDTLLLCSDGLHGPVPDEELERILKSSQDIPLVCKKLINEANARGGPDNITAIVARFSGEDLPDPEEHRPAEPKDVRYVRAPIDIKTLKLEKELGLIHWINKWFFSNQMLLIYGVALLLGGGYWLWKNRDLFKPPPPKRVIAALARVMITSDVPDAIVIVNGKRFGRLENGEKVLSLPLGRHQIYLYSPSRDWKSKLYTLELKSSKKPELLEINMKGSSAKGSSRFSQFKEWLPGRDGEEE